MTRTLIFVFLTSMLITACSKPNLNPFGPTGLQDKKPSEYVWRPDEPIQDKPVTTHTAQGAWQVGETILRGRSGNYREGRSPGGRRYTIYPDGSGGIGELTSEERWSIDCSRDKIDDKRRCSFYNSDNRLFITFTDAGNPHYVCIMGHDFPGMTGAIRVDSNEAISTDKEGCVKASSIIPQLRAGKRVVVRRVEWPYRYNIDDEGSLMGFQEAMQLTTFIRHNIDNLSF
ncbi:hypothetical protein [Tepidicaulis sp.]|uniref:hypothetical protein n=1 Tax=Tepidicaulis sp. TaxID=1920809 RepID=UPI003B5BCD37